MQEGKQEKASAVVNLCVPYQDKLKTILRHLAVKDMAKKAKAAESGESGCSQLMGGYYNYT